MGPHRRAARIAGRRPFTYPRETSARLLWATPGLGPEPLRIAPIRIAVTSATSRISPIQSVVCRETLRCAIDRTIWPPSASSGRGGMLFSALRMRSTLAATAVPLKRQLEVGSCDSLRRGAILEISSRQRSNECLGAMHAEPWCWRDDVTAALRPRWNPSIDSAESARGKPRVAAAIREPSTKRRLVSALCGALQLHQSIVV